MTYARSLTFAVGILLAFVACESETEPDVDPVATYDVFGRAFEPAPALPVQAILAEPDRYAGTALMVEGVLHDACAERDCWMTMEADSVRLILRQPAFDAPASVAGRRAVVHGRMIAGDDGFSLEPTGVMVEKVRS